MGRRPKNPLNAEPFQGVQDACRGFLVARPAFVDLKDIERYTSREDAEKGVMRRHGRRIEWRI